MDYFSLFRLPLSYLVDDNLLLSRYRLLQKNFHPDCYIGASSQERLLVLQRAMDINEGFSILKDPVKRAAYLLKIHGIDMNDEHHIIRDEVFLTEQLVLREELDKLGNQPSDDNSFNLLLKNIENKYLFWFDLLTKNLVKKNWKEASEILVKFQFFYKLKKQVALLKVGELDA